MCGFLPQSPAVSGVRLTGACERLLAGDRTPASRSGWKFKGIKVLLSYFAHFVVKINLDLNVCFSYFETEFSIEVRFSECDAFIIINQN